MELQNQKLAEQLDAAQRRHDEQMQQLVREVSRLRQQVVAGKKAIAAQMAAAMAPFRAPKPGNGADQGTAPETSDGRHSHPPQPGNGDSDSSVEKKRPLKGNFGPGFELTTEDGEFQLQFHQETQFDAR